MPKAITDAAITPATLGRKISPPLVGVALAPATPDVVPEGTRDDVSVLEAVEAVAVQLTKGHIRSVARTCDE